jgi:type II secretory pathway pseudopilin PulG
MRLWLDNAARQSRTPRCAAFTLFEVLIALSLLVVVAALTIPALGAMYGDYRLKQDAELVRIKVGGTRIRAIDAGVTYQFRFEPGGNRFVILPDQFEVGDFGGQGSAGTFDLEGQQIFRTSGQISEGLTFRGAFGEMVGTERLSDSQFAGLPEARRLAEATWSSPILFHADGTSMNAEFEIIDAKNQFVRVSVRGLTGAVSASRVDRELDR